VNAIAHIGNIPVEEWLPFVVPVVALYVYGRRRGRHRRKEVELLPGAGEMLDEGTVERVLARWSESRHGDASAHHLLVLYPPGPDGLTAGELAGRTGSDPAGVERLLAELEDLGYVEGYDGPEQRVCLTIEGYDLVNVTESVLLEAARERRKESRAGR
jgi:hypothetical protein